MLGTGPPTLEHEVDGHEDGLQSGLAVAEQLGGVRRPWTVENESGRIQVTAPATRGASMSRPAVQVA